MLMFDVLTWLWIGWCLIGFDKCDFGFRVFDFGFGFGGVCHFVVLFWVLGCLF